MKRQKPHLGFLPVAAAHLARPPGGPVGWPSPASAGHRLQPPTSRQEGVCPSRARTRRPPPACLPRPDPRPETPDASPRSSPSLSALSVALCSLSRAHPSGARRRRRKLPRPPSIPCLPDGSRGTAIAFCVVNTNPFDRGSPTSPPRVVFAEHGRRTPSTDSSPFGRPRAS
mgnify:CR=1 FL=1